MAVPKRFIFDSYELNIPARTILLRYAYDTGQSFTETFVLPENVPLDNAASPEVDRALFALHLAVGVSYYKAFCPNEIEIRSGALLPEQAEFWNVFYTKGLGEFFYLNKIDFRGLVNFVGISEAPEPLLTSQPSAAPHKTLLPFGGGKDSVVTLELLKKHGSQPTLFRLRGHQFIDQLAELVGLPMITVERQLDTQLFDLNAQGAYNGHVPITGVIGFLSVVVCLLAGHDSVAFSNERSADYGSVEYLGERINHQWSKSLEAEQMMRSYIAEYITGDIQYLNPLRPLSELAITRIFARYPQYFMHTTSCNRNWLMLDKNPHQGAWCGQCYKCHFMFAMYAANLPEDTVVKMYGKNLFLDEALLHSFRQLWGAEGIKPFDCVGTPEEMQAAMYVATKKPVFANTPIGKDFTEHMLPTIASPESIVADALNPNYDGVPANIHRLLEGEL